ncbi:exodeoxyribonuclease V subunit beta, partial [Candidatus Accumulibacter vicinus]|uniref:exodeoxyribonuclease V subunit beta n=1 Tax=Candidatus Accumulibacter vicinus TaxID=2954382 RepID=UPI00235B6CC9
MSPATLPTAPGTTVETLDPLRFPLHGSRLIEASAGTGKTFTIAALYVRLVLGHGAENAYARPLTPREILVVTFTEAATQELRDRIRVRLAQAAACFRVDAGEDPGENDSAVADALLRALRQEYPAEQWPACARKLQLAAEAMDEAAVSTIHAWCQRMLREHAFDCDSLFTQTLETDPDELLAEVVRDYWRSFLAALDREAVAEVRPWCSGPAALQAHIRNLVAHADRLAESPRSPAEALRASLSERRRRLAELKAPWAEWVAELQTLLDTARDQKQFDGTRLKKNHYDNWLLLLAQWCEDPDRVDLGLTDAAKRRLTPDGLAEVWKTAPSPDHPALTAIAGLSAALQALPDARIDLLRHAARWVAQRFADEQARRAQMGFNDLLTRLDAALHAPSGQRLADSIRQQFPVALIDEFQDTDPVQYRIFEAVYRVARNARDCALILIGDPKQAIYAFRGADIHTYLAARHACLERLYTLNRNYRSTRAMVLATNHCFAVAEDRASGAGAFLFRRGTDNPVPFITAEVQGRADALQADGMPVPALTVWYLPPNPDGKPLGRTAYREQMAASCAGEMVRLLNLGQARRAGFAGETGLQSVRPADLAVLVNSRSEADTMRRALAQRGVRSVYLSDKDSVFESAEAGELQHWLAACAEPDDGRLLRSALATAMLGLSWRELDTLNHDEIAWEARVLQFRGYRDCWRRQGVLPMLRRLLNDFEVPARLLGRGDEGGAVDGERTLTNVLHLAELLQQASALLDGEHALIRHLAEQRRDAASAGSDARQLRLESDADLVRVVTVHKSKGLEYPLVFLPFACAFRASDARDLPLKWHDDDGCLQLALAADAGIVDRADRERLGEDLRKLYVALTRARYATWIGVAPLKDLERSAFGYLLGGGEAVTAAALPQALAAWRDHCPHIVLALAPAASAERFLPQAS